METQESPIVAGIFRDRSIAEHARGELLHAGFRNDQMRLWGQTTASGRILDGFMSTLSGHEKDVNLYGSLIEQGVSEEDAAYYQRELESGHIIATVESFGHRQQAQEILYHCGSYDANTNAASMKPMHKIQLREEILEPHTQTVEVGEVTIRKVVVTEEKTITVTMKREELVFERHPVASEYSSERPDLESQLNHPVGRIIEIGEGETIIIPLRSQQLVVEKRPVVIEELLVGKRKVQEAQHFSDMVRREEASIEKEGDVIVREKRLQRDIQPEIH
jgi:uncharacterized protein (TIGR02271 family)